MKCGDAKMKMSSGMTGVHLKAVAIYQICKVQKRDVFDKHKKGKVSNRECT